MNRRGAIFLILSLLLVVIMLTVMYAQRTPTAAERSESIIVRIGSMDDFLKDFHQDIPRAAFISGFRSLIAIEQYITEEGTFVSDPGPIFIEAFMNGTIDGESYDVLVNSTFNDYLDRINAEAGRIGVSLDSRVVNVTLSQSTPWSVDVSLSLVANVTDTRGLARWDYERNFSTEISILDLRDPLYSVSTYGKVPTTFRRSVYNNSDMVSGNDTTNLNDEVFNMYYREDPYAPSFLQRMAGNLSASSKYGIASLVDLDELNAQEIGIDTSRSILDYVYFGNGSTTNYCPQLGEPLSSWFKIDATHYNDVEHDFEVDELNATIC